MFQSVFLSKLCPIKRENRSGLFLVLGPKCFRGPWRWRKSSNGNGRAIKVLFLIGFLVLSANNACWVPLPVLVIVPVLILVPVLVPECQSLLFGYNSETSSLVYVRLHPIILWFDVYQSSPIWISDEQNEKQNIFADFHSAHTHLDLLRRNRNDEAWLIFNQSVDWDLPTMSLAMPKWR